MKTSIIRISFMLALASGALVAVAQETAKHSEHIFINPQTMPTYPGGEKAMYEFIRERIIYPKEALKERVEGRVTLRFVISKTGEVKDVTVLRGLHPGCDSIAVNIVRAMPKWTPSKFDGKEIPIYYTLPVIFKLPEEFSGRNED